MKRVGMVVAVWGLAGLGLVGCETGGKTPTSSKPAGTEKVSAEKSTAEKKVEKSADAAKTATAAVKPEYQEITNAGKTYVVGTKESAERVRQGGKPTSFVAEFGYGPDGKTVYFENKPDGIEQALRAEYAKRHNIK